MALIGDDDDDGGLERIRFDRVRQSKTWTEPFCKPA